MEQLKQSHDGYCKSTLESSGIIDGIQSNLQIQYAKSNLLEQLHKYTRAISGGKRIDDIIPPSVSAGPSSRKRSALSDITNSSTDKPPESHKQKRKKRGRKNNEEKAAHDCMLKFTLLDLIVDPECRTTWRYCNAKDMIFMHKSLDRFIKSEKRLMHILCGKRRMSTENVAEAIGIVERRLPSDDAQQPARQTDTRLNEQSDEQSDSVAADLPQQVVQTRHETRSIFNFQHLKDQVDELDFDTPTQKSRDDLKQIKIHKRKYPTETLKYLIFDLANRVTVYSNLDHNLRKEVLKYSAMLLFYDHGYKQLSGISRLDKTWGKRLEKAYLGGSDISPLRSNVRGPTVYTDKLQKQHPGYIHELYRYAEKAVGNQASHEVLAQCMNEKSKRRPGFPITKFNKTNLWRWFKGQGGNERSPKEKPYLTEDQKKGRLDWCEQEKKRAEEWGDDFHAVFLDEKWFYLASRQRKIKVLPPGPGKDPDKVAPHIPTAISRRHALKVNTFAFHSFHQTKNLILIIDRIARL